MTRNRHFCAPAASGTGDITNLFGSGSVEVKQVHGKELQALDCLYFQRTFNILEDAQVMLTGAAMFSKKSTMSIGGISAVNEIYLNNTEWLG